MLRGGGSRVRVLDVVAVERTRERDTWRRRLFFKDRLGGCFESESPRGVVERVWVMLPPCRFESVFCRLDSDRKEDRRRWMEEEGGAISSSWITIPPMRTGGTPIRLLSSMDKPPAVRDAAEVLR